MTGDVTNTQVLDSPVWQSDDSDVANIRNCTTIGLICGAVNTHRRVYTNHAVLANIRRNISSHFWTAKDMGSYYIFKQLWVLLRNVAWEANFDLRSIIQTNLVISRGLNYWSAIVDPTGESNEGTGPIAGTLNGRARKSKTTREAEQETKSDRATWRARAKSYRTTQL